MSAGDATKQQVAKENPEMFKGLVEIGCSFSFAICDKDGSKTVSFPEFKKSMPAVLQKTRDEYKKNLAKKGGK